MAIMVLALILLIPDHFFVGVVIVCILDTGLGVVYILGDGLLVLYIPVFVDTGNVVGAMSCHTNEIFDTDWY